MVSAYPLSMGSFEDLVWPREARVSEVASGVLSASDGRREQEGELLARHVCGIRLDGGWVVVMVMVMALLGWPPVQRGVENCQI